MQASREEDISFIAGLDGATIFVAIIDEHATVLEASSHFSFIGETVKILLQTVDNDISVKPFYIAGVFT
ncbi:hypothetical protein [Bartonella sp. B39]